MKHKDMSPTERTLAERQQLRDVAWATQHHGGRSGKNRLLHALKLFFSRLRARKAVHSIRSQAHREGLEHLTDNDINALINQAREKRKRDVQSKSE